MVLSQCGLKVLVTSSASDSHNWNLVFLQLLIEEMGHQVVNLGPCVPDELLVRRCRAHAPDLVVISSVNGHGYRDGLTAITRLRRDAALAEVPVVIGGKLGVTGAGDADSALRLLTAGFTAVFDDGDLTAFQEFVSALAAGASPALRTRRVAT
ncbi:cobalamin B12-binding domain-containing protein [Streptomyces sp. AK02-01A]|uniref:cobalamin B12-binding domain-containing protein n=1 Tax=Streptomyces sp. AK02-01A TaxID=3028648 RepID=UPI0029A88BC9|nr:cobalamin B12-binding domain-containing protein [Streptomyces sp. AK02-01A]MDX3854825.1 cobalamin B12-binding domain-containing protein [Streptomyces sp. AK02-01A]